MITVEYHNNDCIVFINGYPIEEPLKVAVKLARANNQDSLQVTRYADGQTTITNMLFNYRR